MISLTRRYRFPASHRLHSPLLSDAENARLYGKCNNRFGHGHDYTLELTIAGELNAASGLLLPLAHLDRFVKDHILRLFAYRNLPTWYPRRRT
jgi:6-pyruvoyltetrahydropterin/6-carboxytetrahydropterin synthase